MTFRSKVLGVLAAMTALSAAATADAGETERNRGLQYLRDYNLIVLGNLNSKSEVEGRTFVKGNLEGNSSNYFTKPGASAKPGLTVGGNVTGSTKNLNNGSGALVGGSVNSGFNLNGAVQTVKAGGQVKNTNVNQNTVQQNVAGLQNTINTQASDMVLTLGELSTYFASLPATATQTTTSNLVTFDPAGTGGLAVFNVSNVSAFSNRNLFVDPTGYGTVVINVAGTNVTIPSSTHFQNGSGLGQNVIWNFYQATSLTFNDAFYGTVLAPNAAATTSNFIEGTAVFKSLTQNGEIHMNNYSGVLQYAQNIGQATQAAVPEPATWAMMIGGFGVVGAVIRRRKVAQAA